MLLTLIVNNQHVKCFLRIDYVGNYVSYYVEKNKTMALRKTDETKVRSLTKIAGGSSYAVTIPIDFIRTLKWRGKQKLEVKLYRDRIIIRDWKP